MVLDYHYTRTGVLGTGGFGTVYRALRSNDTLPVAIKVIPADKVNSSAKLLAREVDIMHQLSMSRHECVMGLTDALLSVPSADAASQGAFEVHLVMPLYASTLHDYAQSLRSAYSGCVRRPREAAAAAASAELNVGAVASPDERHHRALLAVAAHAPFLAFRLTAGLQYIHQCRLAHRDLKPVNVMVTIDHSSPRRSAAVLGDFGLCNAAAPSDTFYVGTRQYRAPEMITNTSRNSTATDVWSLGCTLYEIVTGGPLFGLPSARAENGAWSPQNASAQLEALLDVFGRPEPATIEKVPATNVKSYLMKTRDRPCRVPELVRQNFKLLPPGAPGREELVELWVDLIMRCLRWLPEERPTCKELLQHPLFRRAHCFVVYSEAERAAALQQHPDALVVLEPQPISYKGGATKETKEGNKEKIRQVVQRVNEAAARNLATPVPSEADTTLTDENFDFPVPSTARVRNAFADLAALLADPLTAYNRAAVALSQLELSTVERAELDAVRRFCEGRTNSDPPLRQPMPPSAPLAATGAIRGSDGVVATENAGTGAHHGSHAATPLAVQGGDGSLFCASDACWVSADHVVVSTAATFDAFPSVDDL